MGRRRRHHTPTSEARRCVVEEEEVEGVEKSRRLDRIFPGAKHQVDFV
jgi:hypothetical protein